MDRPLFIKWQDKNNTGIALVDEQHRGIVSIINSFYSLMEKGTGDRMLYSCISDTMKNYSRIHFITEERYLQAMGYPNFEEHKEMHRNLALEIECIEHIAIQENNAKPLLDFLKKWWLEHINKQDMQYARYLHESGKIRGFF
ncbi:MAG: bacteriohemerythrin [Betaproteobacteria bacterium]|nr:bacteriohemerythrin [Betaproteobacteria bacterium]